MPTLHPQNGHFNNQKVFRRLRSWFILFYWRGAHERSLCAWIRTESEGGGVGEAGFKRSQIAKGFWLWRGRQEKVPFTLHAKNWHSNFCPYASNNGLHWSQRGTTWLSKEKPDGNQNKMQQLQEQLAAGGSCYSSRYIGGKKILQTYCRSYRSEGARA